MGEYLGKGRVDPLIGLERGDEGKGKIALYLVQFYPVIARFNGGANAGHEVTLNGKRVTLHQNPESVIYSIIHPEEEKLGIIGNSSLFDPVLWRQESDGLRNEHGIVITPETLAIGENAYVVMPHHKLRDALSEGTTEDKQGTTRKGMRYAAADQAAHKEGHAILMRHDLKKLGQTARQGLEEYNAIASMHGVEPVDLEHELDSWLSMVEESHAADYIKDVDDIVQKRLRANENILAVGGQGWLLDVNRGMVPFTSSSNTGVAGVLSGLGVGPKQVGNIRGVAKVFPTHVGGGPFLSKIEDRKIAEIIIYGPGAEIGKTTGRERQPGWLDLPVLRSGIRHNNVDELVLTKLDIAYIVRDLGGLATMPVITTYVNSEGQELRYAPSHVLKLEGCTTRSIEASLPESDVSKVRRRENLDEASQRLLELISKETGTPIELISNGPELDQIITY
ncbi:MAG TPA: adenylosuccinate synthetase [Candidatus Saccharimonadales bacterium]|nr:adenylosuccinate synthetase [Candidatus Saccharimonadales bacterium]